MEILSFFLLLFIFYIFIIYGCKFATKCSTADAKKMVNQEIAEFFSAPQPPPPPVAIIGQVDMDEIAKRLSKFFSSILYYGMCSNSKGYVIYVFSVYGLPEDQTKLASLKKIVENEIRKYLITELFWDCYYVFCAKLIEGEMVVCITNTPSGAQALEHLKHSRGAAQRPRSQNIVERITKDE